MTAGPDSAPAVMSAPAPQPSESPAPLRVLVVTTSYPRRAGDSAGHFVQALVREVARLGCRVTVLAPHEAGLPVSETAEDRVVVRRFRYMPERLERVAYGDGIVPNLRRYPSAVLGLPGFALRLRRAVRAYAPDADVVHVHWAPTAALAGATLARSAVVLTTHGSDTTLARKGGVWRRLLISGLRHAGRVIAVSEEQVDLLRGERLWDGPIDVLPCGVPAYLVDRARPERSPGAPFTFVYAGRLVVSKGVHELMEGFARVASARSDVRLVVVGGGPEAERMRQSAAAAGIEEHVEFRGPLPHDETLSLMGAADAFVLASHGEGSPLSVTEALALGTPVIGTRVGAMPELLGDDGLLVPRGDIAALAEAMRRLISDMDLAERLSREGRDRVRERYTWSRLAAETVRVYREAAGA